MLYFLLFVLLFKDVLVVNSFTKINSKKFGIKPLKMGFESSLWSVLSNPLNNLPKFSIPSLPSLSSDLSIMRLPGLNDFSSFSNNNIDIDTIKAAIENGDIKSILTALSSIDIPLNLELSLLSVTGLLTISAAFASVPDPNIDEAPYPGTATGYNVEKADSFFNKRPLFVAKRAIQLSKITNAFILKLLIDWRTGNLEKNQPIRAKEALALATQLGPTFIKLGQALSIRTDLIPEAYALELRQLQDQVPPFDNKEAKEVIRRELGVGSISQVFSVISDQPIASASIGQVYKATLIDGREVAVKVKRPGILGEIALDLYLLRALTPFQTRIANFINKIETNQADIDIALALVDEWGRGFVAEVDYRTENKNSKEFRDAMERRGLTAVTAPKAVDEFSTSNLIVTEWVEGTRLDLDSSPDVPRLCGVAINAYLTMLLDTGVLHCDPHPGNLKRTPDGRLCILDWGMTLDVPDDLQYGLLEFIAHVNTEDYDSMPEDFVNLGFTPADKLEKVKNSGLTEGLAFALRQLNKGGGPAQIQARVKEEFKERYGSDLTDEELRDRARSEMIERMEDQLREEGVDVNGVTNVMEEMSRRNRELFKLPSYVLYVSRAFSTLEGIGLSANQDYSILQECYPYLAKRLMTDDSPRAKEALRSMLYGAGASNSGMLSPDKLIEMSEGFGTFTSFTSGANSAASDTPTILAMDTDDSGMEAFVDLLLSEQGSGIQELLVEESARLTDASIRNSIEAVEKSPLGVAMKTAMKTPVQLASLAPGPLKPFIAPATAPYRIAKGLKRLSSKEADDEQALSTLQALYATLGSGAGSSGNGTPDIESLRQFASDLITDPKSPVRQVLGNEKLLSRVPEVARLASRFSTTLINRTANRFDEVASHYNEAHLEGMNEEDREADVSNRVVSLVASSVRTVADATQR